MTLVQDLRHEKLALGLVQKVEECLAEPPWRKEL